MAYAWEFNVRAALPLSLPGVGVDAQRRALGLASKQVMDAVIKVWPVDTGLSLAGFRREVAGESWIVFNNVSYTKYVHDGLATRTAIQTTAAVRSQTEAALDRILARQRVPGARGNFQLIRGGRLPGRSRAVKSALEVVEPLEVANRSVYRLVSAQIRTGNFESAVATLRRNGLTSEARKVRRMGRLAGQFGEKAVA